MQEPKFKVGDLLHNTFTGKTGKVSALHLSETDVNNDPNPTWYYSIDHIGWLFDPEEDLEEI